MFGLRRFFKKSKEQGIKKPVQIYEPVKAVAPLESVKEEEYEIRYEQARCLVLKEGKNPLKIYQSWVDVADEIKVELFWSNKMVKKYLLEGVLLPINTQEGTMEFDIPLVAKEYELIIDSGSKKPSSLESLFTISIGKKVLIK